MNKNLKWISAIYSFILIALFLLCILVFENRPNSFWVGQVFSIIVLVFIILSFGLMGYKGADQFLGIPLVLISSVFFSVQLVISIVLAIIPFSVKNSIIIELVLMFLYMLIAICSQFAVSIEHDEDTKVADSVHDWNQIEKILRIGMARCGDMKVKQQLEKIIDEVHYSNPVSSTDTSTIEKLISELSLKVVEEIENSMIVEQICKEIKKLLEERAAICSNRR